MLLKLIFIPIKIIVIVVAAITRVADMKKMILYAVSLTNNHP